ncbi:MAG: nuclear transport factor 2 family protein [Longimicrobiales bacterium]
MTRRTILAVLALLLAVPSAHAQSADEQAAEQVVRDLFDHMRNGDAEAMRALFHPDARLVTTGMRDGQPLVRLVPVPDWLQGVAGADRVLDERLYETEVRVAENLAFVWTEYSLFVGGQFSHCGTDLFDLVRTADGWRIIQVADTRKQEGCRTS